MIASGSGDASIRIWDLKTNSKNSFLTFANCGYVKCLIQLNSGMIDYNSYHLSYVKIYDLKTKTDKILKQSSESI